MVVWVSDLHCNCSFRNLFRPTLHLAVLEEEFPRTNLTADRFQVPTQENRGHRPPGTGYRAPGTGHRPLACHAPTRSLPH